MNPLQQFNEDQVQPAFEKGRAEKKPVVIDFWSPGCKGCEKMEDITYQDTKVIEYLSSDVVFVKYNTYNITKDFKHSYLSAPFLWTPTFIIFSPNGSEVRKAVGYLPPVQFLAEIEMGKALAELRNARSASALTLLERILSN